MRRSTLSTPARSGWAAHVEEVTWPSGIWGCWDGSRNLWRLTMINHTTVLAHTGNTDSQMLFWTDKIHSADRQSCENYQQPHTNIYTVYNCKSCCCPWKYSFGRCGHFFKLCKRIKINKNSIIKKLKQIYQLMNIDEILFSFYTLRFIPSYILCNRDIWMKCTNHPGGVIVSSRVWLPWSLQRLLAAWQCVSLKWRGRGWRCILVNSKGRAGALAALLPNAPRRLHH